MIIDKLRCLPAYRFVFLRLVRLLGYSSLPCPIAIDISSLQYYETL